MRSLEISTQRILRNLIKQNQKLSSDSVLNQSGIQSNVRSPEPRVQSPAFRVQHSTLVSRFKKSGVAKKPKNILRLKKTYDLKIPQSIAYKEIFCYIFFQQKKNNR